jgi:hypothetical protein
MNGFQGETLRSGAFLQHVKQDYGIDTARQPDGDARATAPSLP